jgi:hypothetical protein
MKTLIGSINRSPLRCGFFTLTIALCWFALSPPLKAQCPSACGTGGNTAVGDNALDSLTTGLNNTAVGKDALTSNTIGAYNVAIGRSTLSANVSGNFNMAIGTEALRDTTANYNLAIGFRVGFVNTTGNHLTGIGAGALLDNTTGSFNTAIGSDALANNISTDFNVAVGDGALTAFNGTATTDGANTALGSIALVALTSGEENVAVGRRALEFATSGNNNTALGWRAGDGVLTGDGSTCLGSNTCTNNSSADNVVCIGQNSAGENFSNRAYIPNVGAFTQNFSAGVVDFVTVRLSDGKLGHTASSRRYKDDIKSMGDASELIYKLKPVTFRFKKTPEYQGDTLDYGLIAEDVAEIDPKLAIRDGKGQIESLRYLAIYNMMLNEFLKEHKKVEEQQASIADLKSTVALQQKEMQVFTAQLKEQAAQIQKVSAQLEASRPAPKVVANK